MIGYWVVLLAGLAPAQHAARPACSWWPHERSPTELRALRRAAYDEGRIDDMLDLVECEIDARQDLSASAFGPPRDGEFSELCDAVEAGFDVCIHHWPEDGCAAEYLQRYVTEGCLEDTAQRPRWFVMQSVYWRSRLNYAQALDSLASAEARSATVLLRNLLREEEAGLRLAMSAMLDLVIAAGWRVELAGQLRNRAAVVEQVSRLEALLSELQQLSQRSAALLEAARRTDGSALDPIAETDPFGALTIIANTKVQVGWALLLMRESQAEASDPVPWLQSALETYTQGPRRHRSKADNVRINLALAALQDGKFAEVERHTEQLATDRMSDEEILWLRLIQARASLAQGHLTLAETQIRDIEQVAAVGAAPMGRWYAAWGRGLYFDALGLADAALLAYADADAILEDHATHWSPWAYGTLADGRYLMLGAASQRLVQLLVQRGDVAEATDTARRVRSRAFRMAARATCPDLERPAAELPTVEPGELRLLYVRLPGRHPGDKDGDAGLWAGFAVTDRGSQAQLLKLPEEPSGLLDKTEAELGPWSDALLAPFAREIAGASSIVVLASESLHDVAFHALPWDGSILLDAVPVAYGLDTHPCAAPSMQTKRGAPPGRTLVLHGGENNLVREADAVMKVLQDNASAAERLEPTSVNDLSGLLDGSYDMAHIVVHGQQAPGAELSKVDDHLHFTDSLKRTRFVLTREAILAARRTPSVVTTSACKSSFADAEMLGGGLSVAHAFLLKGARFVSGPVAEVDGELASDVASKFYEELATFSQGNVLEAWQAANLARWRTDDERHLRMLRLYTF